MSELDLGGAPQQGALVLTPPAPVVVVEPQQAAGAVPLQTEKQLELRRKAAAFVEELAAIDTSSPAFQQKVASITSMGEQDMRAAAANLDFERAASLRDKIRRLRTRDLGLGTSTGRLNA